LWPPDDRVTGDEPAGAHKGRPLYEALLWSRDKLAGGPATLRRPVSTR
jgi:hypothetical protein